MTLHELEDELLNDIQKLNLTVWANRVDNRRISEWLRGFASAPPDAQEIRLHALYLLSRFMYFGDSEVRELLRASYRDHFRYPIVASARRLAGNTTDAAVLNAAFSYALSRTRFIGFGNPSESGTHLLYVYRQMNSLPKKCFITAFEAIKHVNNRPELRDPDVRRYIFLDDFCGSGSQATQYAAEELPTIQGAASRAGVDIAFEYHVLVATSRGLDQVRSLRCFKKVACILELDDSYKAFSANSRHFIEAPAQITQQIAREVAYLYGMRLQPDAPLGWDDGQLMLGFSHNTPDNTLPIFWHTGVDRIVWQPVFRRYTKLYS